MSSPTSTVLTCTSACARRRVKRPTLTRRDRALGGIWTAKGITHRRERLIPARMAFFGQDRISGLLLGRIGIHTQLPGVEHENLSDDRLGEPSAMQQSHMCARA